VFDQDPKEARHNLAFLLILMLLLICIESSVLPTKFNQHNIRTISIIYVQIYIGQNPIPCKFAYRSSTFVQISHNPVYTKA
jgi:hypothetical protein